MNNKKLKLGKIALITSVLSLAEYGIEHVLYLISDAAISGASNITADTLTALGTIFGYTVQAIEVFALAFTALFALLAFTMHGIRRSAACIGISAASRLLYLIPHYYMTILSYGYDSVETLLLLIPVSLFISIFFCLGVSLAALVGILPARARSNSEGTDVRAVFNDDISRRDTLDLGNSTSAAIAIAALAASLSPLVAAIINTVTLLTDRGGSMTASMLIGVMLDFIMIIATFLAVHLILSAIKRTLASDVDDNDGKGDNTDNNDINNESNTEVIQ